MHVKTYATDTEKLDLISGRIYSHISHFADREY